MQFTTTAQALATLLQLSLVTAAPGAQTAPASGLVQRLDTRSAPVGDLLFGREISCPSNDPSICCACRGGYGTCINDVCYCQGGDC
ncbi:hypothetical protein N0V93_001944 [Gnomoniopsis smithogilvyi]|uniref:Uncharacterized protein n=1 Tax=Gnomoniopsis smithogilvyi TaxID=1191159 RepID=A0A9W8Z6H2_9PEZI|nr:hypothetical protein N0V93_001944 [Gnomoniopsis smithogilvyi]